MAPRPSAPKIHQSVHFRLRHSRVAPGRFDARPMRPWSIQATMGRPCESTPRRVQNITGMCSAPEHPSSITAVASSSVVMRYDDVPRIRSTTWVGNGLAMAWRRRNFVLRRSPYSFPGSPLQDKALSHAESLLDSLRYRVRTFLWKEFYDGLIV